MQIARDVLGRLQQIGPQVYLNRHVRPQEMQIGAARRAPGQAFHRLRIELQLQAVILRALMRFVRGLIAFRRRNVMVGVCGFGVPLINAGIHIGVGVLTQLVSAKMADVVFAGVLCALAIGAGVMGLRYGSKNEDKA